MPTTQPAVPLSSHVARAEQTTLPVLVAARELSAKLAKGRPLATSDLREAMENATGGTDAEGLWQWKDAYDALEAAQVLFLRKYLPAMRAKAKNNPEELWGLVHKVLELTPTHTRRTLESQALQQFSTPITIGLIAALAAHITPGDIVLEPSAGTGLLAVFAESMGARLHLNELSHRRRAILTGLFPNATIHGVNAEHIDDLLPASVVPSVVLMNPPFSASPHVGKGLAGTDLRHMRAALRRLAPGGRLVAITSYDLDPWKAGHRQAFVEIGTFAALRYSQGLWGQLYKRHGTTVATRLHVFDRTPGDPFAARMVPGESMTPHLLAAEVTRLPARLPCVVAVDPVQPLTRAHQRAAVTQAAPEPGPVIVPPMSYEIAEVFPSRRAGQGLYEPYQVERIVIPGAIPHPTTLVQSAAMASVQPPVPTYRPRLPASLVTQGLLSDAQLESVIYAGDAHSAHLAGHWAVNDTLDQLRAVSDDDASAVRFRKGWFLGDGPGAGKGRQIAGILLDNWNHGRRKAVWISKSDKLIEDAQRDWTALGQEKLLIVPQDRYRHGAPIKISEGIIFTTYATMRSGEREGKKSRLDQLLAWLGPAFDGVIVFDEAHAMANAASSSGERGVKAASQQGLAGLKLQHALPDARIVYVSATGATQVENLAYAQRLGLWGSDEFPFATRADFVTAMATGGIAAMEVLARDLKALGLYTARALSYEGVEVDILDHELTPEQIRIYDAYARGFQIIHRNLDAALRATNITGEEGTLNRNALSAARSAFESNKQRFFAHLITAMKVPTLISAITRDLADGHAAIVQLVSTSEALMERRLADIPPSEWNDLSVDVTPREYVLDYLKHSFPVTLHELYDDDEGVVSSRPVTIDGQPVVCKEAIERRDALIRQLAALPPVQAALDQIIHHFGADAVAEITGRGRRIVADVTPSWRVLKVVNRPASSNLAETQAFMDDKKRILVFSDAGGTGRSYHADRACLNTRKRIHYLLEAGWKADTAIQGLGRSNRTNQAQPPLFRPVTTDVRGEKRFLSTIARRLDSLGAITRGQRETGGQGLFRPEDNLESRYGHSALTQFYGQLYHGHVPCISLQRFMEVTGLNILDADGSLREDLPRLATFLNRVLALEIHEQNSLFAHFEGLLAAKVEGAMQAGTYEVGLETITADAITITARTHVATHAGSGAETVLLTANARVKTSPRPLAQALGLLDMRLLINARSGRAAALTSAPSWTLENGEVQERARLVRPLESSTLPLSELAESAWEEADAERFAAAWTTELAGIPEFTDKQFHVVTGLLLPIWNNLPADNPRVYRFTTSAGERVIGRLVAPEHLPSLVPDAVTSLSAEAIYQALLNGQRFQLTDDRVLRRSLVMGNHRIELTGFADTDVDRLRALGLVSEIIQWRLRLFVPLSREGPDILGKVLALYPARAV